MDFDPDQLEWLIELSSSASAAGRVIFKPLRQIG
jgi:hypothetical protein